MTASEITRMTLQDLDTVIELGLTVPELQDRDEPEFFSREVLTAWLANPHDALLVARERRQVLGFIIASFHPQARIGYIYDLALIPAARGKGLGRALVEAVLNRFESQQASEIWCLVHEHNQAAAKLFESYGLARGRRFYLHIRTGS